MPDAQDQQTLAEEKKRTDQVDQTGRPETSSKLSEKIDGISQAGSNVQPTAREAAIAAAKGISNKRASESDSAPMGETGTRSNPVVNFHEKCAVYEIDLEEGNGAQLGEEKPTELNRRNKPSPFVSVRYYVMILALIGPFVITYSRTIINFAITDMIDPAYVVRRQADPLEGVSVQPNATTAAAYFDLDHSCPVNDEVRKRLLAENKQDVEMVRAGLGDKFQWDTFKQGLLKAAYAIGHAPLQIPGSRMSEIYGSHWVISIGSLLIAMCCLIAPYLASIHFYLIFGDLVFLGVLGSFLTPALITLFSNWLTPSEKSLMLSLYLVPSRLGYALSAMLCGLLIQAQLSWRYVFYSAGWISLAFAATFLLCARSRPTDHPLISQLELDYLASKNTLVREGLARKRAAEAKKKRKKEIESHEMKSTSVDNDDGASKVQNDEEFKKSKKPTNSAPWFEILTNVPVWAFIITKFCVKLAGDTVQIELPTYLKRVMHYSPKDNGTVNAWNYVIFCGGCVFVGSLAKTVIKLRPLGLSKTAIRKIFQCTASFGVGLALLGIAYSVCNKTWTQISLLTMFLVTTFGIGGEAQIPLDLTERYPGTIHAMGSSIAFSGVIEPTLVGFLMRGHAADQDSWRGVWFGASAIAFLGGFVFLFFADARIQPFDRIGHESDKPTEENEKTPSNGNDNKAFVKDVDARGKVVKTDVKQLAENEIDKIYKESRQI